MNKFNTLLKLELKANSLLASIRSAFKGGDKAARRMLWAYFAVLIVLIIFLFTYIFLADAVMGAAVLMGNGMPGILLSLVFMVYCVVSILFGTFSVLSKLFMAKDNEFLATLPVSQGTVFSVKFTHAYLGQLLLSAFFILPPCVIYGLKAYDPAAYPLGLLMVLAAPVIPMFVSTLLAMLVMRLAAKMKNRDTMVMIMSLVLVAAVIVLQSSFYSFMPDELPENFFSDLLSSNVSALERICAAFPPAGWMGSVITASGAERFYALLLLAAVIILLGIIIFLLGRKVYSKSALTLTEAPARKVRARKLSDASSPVKAIFKKEWKSILKTPIYAMNSLSGALVLPIMLLVIWLGGSMDMNVFMDELGYDPTNFSHIALCSVILSAVLFFCGGLNTGGATMVTREGKSIWILKVVPVPAAKIVRAKLLASLSISYASLIIPAVIVAVLMGGAIIETLIALIIAVLLCTASAAICLLFDCCHPNLGWQNPTQAIKQSLNAGMAVIVEFALIIILGIAAFFLYNISPTVMLAGIIAISLLLAVISLALLNKKGARALENIEG